MAEARKKDFGVAIILWLLAGSVGAHRVYVDEKVSVLLWYWLVFVCTLSIIFWVDLFKLKGRIENAYDKELIRTKLRG